MFTRESPFKLVLVVVSFDKRGCIQNYSSLGPLAPLFLSGRVGRVVDGSNVILDPTLALLSLDLESKFEPSVAKMEK